MYSENDTNRAGEIVRGLMEDSRFQFKDKGGYLREGICPDCGKKELYVSKSQPWRIACGRENKCGSSWTAKELLPHLFENYIKRFPPTPENPKATADAYMMEDRGFKLGKCRGWYDQEGHRLKDSGEYVPTIRFYLDRDRTRYWERLIGKTKADGQKAHVGGRRKPNGSLFRGDAWVPPGQELKQGDKCFITEGIFHAIALEHTGKKVAAAISSSNFPSNLIESHKGKGVTWVLALDGDHAGRKYMKKFRVKLLAMKEAVEVCLLKNGKKDWDDLWQAGKLDDDFLEECFYQGELFSAGTVGEKVWRIFCRYPTRRRHVIEFGNAIYSARIDSKFSAELQEDNIALNSPEGLEKFRTSCTVDLICNVAPRFLYMEKDELLDEQKYVFQIEYKNGTLSKLMGLEGTSLTSGDAFHKALLNNTNGGRFSGDNKDFSILTRKWLDDRMLEVQSIPFIGYEKNSKAWVYHDNAFQSGRKVKLNEHGYFELGQKGIKTSLGGIVLKTDGDFDPGWLPDYIRAFHYQGLAVLSFFLGTLFAQQIREKHKTFPFLEFTGEPGAGKSTVLEFCWKLVGRDEYEGFDIAKSTTAGRRRAFNQVSNLPIVIIESDRDRGDNEKRPQQFDFDECKPFYNGRSTGTLGVATRSNDVDEQLFQASLLISQNAEVDGSEALLQRIVHCHVDKKHHGSGTREIARWFERQNASTVGGFLELALKNEKRILDTYSQAFKRMEPIFTEGGVRNERIIKNHAQIAACASALPILFPNLTDDVLQNFFNYLGNRALTREDRIAADHPMVEKFWETFHYINAEEDKNMEMNFSSDKHQIAVNLNHFRAQCMAYGQEVMDLTQLKKILPSSKRHKFIEKNRSVWNKTLNKSVKCWIFQA
jgi:hypothetical protein